MPGSYWEPSRNMNWCDPPLKLQMELTAREILNIH